MELLPLKGLKVLDLTNIIMGPYATQLLGDLGAEIIKVETPDGDIMRGMGARKSEKMASIFLGTNRNKRSICDNNAPKHALKKLTILLSIHFIFL